MLSQQRSIFETHAKATGVLKIYSWYRLDSKNDPNKKLLSTHIL